MAPACALRPSIQIHSFPGILNTSPAPHPHPADPQPSPRTCVLDRRPKGPPWRWLATWSALSLPLWQDSGPPIFLERISPTCGISTYLCKKKKKKKRQGVFKREALSFPCGTSCKKICLQCRKPRFDPWVGKSPWRRKWQPTPVFLPGRSHGRRSLVGYSPWGHKELDTTEHAHTLSCIRDVIRHFSISDLLHSV